MLIYNKIVLYLLTVAIVVTNAGVSASDIKKEKRWADQIVDSIMTGEPEWLNANNQKFLAIYTANTTDKSLGAAIILHGVGAHPNWVDVVQPLRTQLPDYGWHTLSIQMPILPNDADLSAYVPLFSEIAPRINAAIDYLQKKDIGTIILIGHSMGATMAGYFMANNDHPAVKALVSIGATGNLFKDPERDYIQSLKKIKKPILDVSGSDDLPDVVKTKSLKATTAKKAGNINYQQVEIKDANHFLVGKETEMLEAIGKWIKQFGS